MRSTKTKEPRLFAVSDTRDGEVCIGCRIEGRHRGKPISVTAWQPKALFCEESIGWLESMARSQYRQRMRQIDEMMKPTPAEP